MLTSRLYKFLRYEPYLNGISWDCCISRPPEAAMRIESIQRNTTLNSPGSRFDPHVMIAATVAPMPQMDLPTP